MARGIPYRMVVFPDKLVPYGPHLPGQPPVSSLYRRCYLPQARNGVRPAFIGDLGNKVTPPMSGDRMVLPQQPGIRHASNGLQNENAVTGRTVLICGDSFFRQSLQSLSFFFRRIFFMRSAFVHHELLPAVRPDLLLAGCAERYLSRVVPDTARPHALSMPLGAGRGLMPTEDFAALWTGMVDETGLLPAL